MSEQPAAGVPTPPRRSRLGTLAVGAVLVVAGLMFTTTAQTARHTQLRSQSADLAALVDAQNAELTQRLRRLTQLRAQYQSESQAGSAGNAQLRGLRKQLAGLEPKAGLTAARGAGVVVTLNDAPRNAPIPPNASPDDLVVHQQDVQSVVNALWAGGATAVMLQDQRVISTSAVRCVGNTLILQGRVYSPPYRITAIGDVPALKSALDAAPQLQYYLQYVAAMDLGYRLETKADLTLPPYDGPLSLTHAKETS